MKGDNVSEVFISRRTSEAGKNHSLVSSLWVSVVLTHCAQMSSTLSIREAATTLGEESSNFRTVYVQFHGLLRCQLYPLGISC